MSMELFRKDEHTFVVGWYGRPGHVGTYTHVVEPGGKVLCGYKPGFAMQFQWCAFISEHAIKYIECPQCRKRVLKLVKKVSNKGA